MDIGIVYTVNGVSKAGIHHTNRIDHLLLTKLQTCYPDDIVKVITTKPSYRYDLDHKVWKRI